MWSPKIRTFILLLVVCFACGSDLTAQQKSPSSEADLKKQADKRFSSDDYTGALPFYSQLLSLYPKSPDYNYRYGVCVLQSSKDKAVAVSYLETASRSPRIEEDVYYYLGRSYMLTNSFNEAIQAFENFKKRAGAGKSKKLEVDLLISNCRSGKEFMKNRRNVVIMNQQQVARSSFYSAYVLDSSSGKMLATPERFLTSIDKNKIINPVMFLTLDGQTIYYASYGKKGDRGKDIYRITKQGDGVWSEPENLGLSINSDEDEDYPFLCQDGITIYFSSRGHNSMGGYDVFKSVYDQNTNQWSVPENLGIPVNTTDDDLFYVPGATGDFAQYASAIESDLGKIGVRKIKLGEVVNELAVISGTYSSQDQPQRKDAKVSVIRVRDNGLVTTVRTDPRTGKYELNVPPGDDYTLVVEAGGYLAHAENFSLAEGLSLADLKQKVELDKTAEVERMTLSNYFTVAAKADGETRATVSAVPTDVISNEYRLKDTDTTKLQPIDIKGRTVYVTPPTKTVATKSDVQTHALFEQNVAANVSENKALPDASKTGNVNVTDKVKESIQDEPVATKENASAQNNEVKEEKVSSQEKKKENRKPEEKTDTKGTGNIAVEAEHAPVVSEKTEQPTASSEVPVKEKKEVAVKHNASSKKDAQDDKSIPENVSNKELIRIAYEDANSLKAEAENLTHSAEMSKELAVEQDSLSKSQVREAQQLLKEGGPEGKEKARLILKESEDNSRQANARFKKAKELEAEAKQLNSEAEESIREAESLAKLDKSDSIRTASRKGKTSGVGLQKPVASSSETKESKEGSHGEADLTTTEKTDHKETAASPVETNEDEVKTETAVAQQVGTKKERQDANHSEGDLTQTGKSDKQETPVSSSVTKDEKPKTEIAASEAKESITENNEVSHAQAEPAESKKESKREVPVTPAIVNEGKPASETASAEPKDNKKQEEKETAIDKPAEKEISKTGGESYSSTSAAAQELKQQDKQNDVAVTTSKEEPGTVTTGTSAATAQPVSPEKAKQSYSQHRELLSESKTLSVKAGDIEHKVETMPASKERERLITLANDLNILSIKKWQESEEKLKEAKQNDPDVVSKMAVADKQKEEMDSKQQVSRSSSAQGTESKLKNNEPDKKLVASNATPKKKNVVVEMVKSDPDEDADEQSVPETPIDTTSPVYPKYVATTAEIKTKQTETINVFADAIKLNKLAQEKKEEEIKIRDKAVVMPESEQKLTELKKADAVKHDADSLTALSQEKFKSAQRMTGTVAALNDQALTMRQTMSTTATAQGKPAITSASTPNTNVAANEKSEEATAINSENKASEKGTISTLKENKVAQQKIYSPLQAPLMTTEDVASESKSASKVSPSNSAPAIAKANVTQPEMKGRAERTVIADKPLVKKILADSSPLPERTNMLALNESYRSPVESIFEVSSKPVYTASNPIPIDPSLPEGLIFKVQIGAFHSPLPQNTFKNLQPVTGETTRPGWIRYCVGLFKAFETANLLKTEMKIIGYKDAFVVAYYNGKRIDLSQAYAMIRGSRPEEKKLYASNVELETSHLRSLNIVSSKVNDPNDEDVNSFYGSTSGKSSVTESGLVEYAVQVGVYKTSKVPASLVSMIPLRTEQTKNGYFRFMTGRYSLYASADSSKRMAVSSGVRDAFIVAYKNGNHVALNTARTTASINNSVNPSVVSNDASAKTDQSPASVSTGVTFKVQLGAFRQHLSENAVGNLQKMTSEEISRETTAGGLTIFYAGLYTDLSTASSAKNQIVSKGIKDAFVAAFLNGKKVPVSSLNK